jgi:hypothetical protein
MALEKDRHANTMGDFGLMEGNNPKRIIMKHGIADREKERTP